MSLLNHASKGFRCLPDSGCPHFISKLIISSVILKVNLHSSCLLSNDNFVDEERHSRTPAPTWRSNERRSLYLQQRNDARFVPANVETQDRRNDHGSNKRREVERRRRFNRRVQGELIYGIGPCIAALKAGRRKIFTVYIAKDREGGGAETIAGLAKDMNIEIRNDMTKREMTTQLLRTDVHQGVALDVTKLKSLPIWERDPSPDDPGPLGKPPLWLLLNKVQDPMNLGAILRTSLFFGVQKVMTTKECSPLSPTVSKASAGAMEIFPVYKALNTKVLLETKREEGWDIIGTVSGHGREAHQPEVTQCENFILHKPSVLVFGNEGFGIDPELEQLCTKRISIQSYSGQLSLIGLDSLNVSVSVGILLHSLLRANSSVPGNQDH